MVLELRLKQSNFPVPIKKEVPAKQPPLMHPRDILRARSKDILTEEEADKLFRLYVNQSIRPQDLARYLKDLCEAENIGYSKDGEEQRSPNWEARKNGYDRALEALRIWDEGKANGQINIKHPTKVIFNVVKVEK